MSEISDLTLSLLSQKHLSSIGKQWLIDQIEALNVLFDNPGWPYNADADHTDAQVRYLAIIMNLERNDRLEILSMIMGYPVESGNDARITRWEYSVLIDYYLNGVGKQFNDTVGYKSATTIREEKRLAREIAKQAATCP